MLSLRDIPAYRMEPFGDSSYVQMDTHVQSGKVLSNQPGLELRMSRLLCTGRMSRAARCSPGPPYSIG